MSQSSCLMLQASRGAVFQLASQDRFLSLATPSSRPIFGVTPRHLAVLASFVDPATPQDVQPLFPAAAETSPFMEVVEDLLSWNLLVVVDALRGHTGGFGHIESHLPMVADQPRVRGYKAAIDVHAPGARVAELGCGTGILSLLAAAAGARSVFAVEESDIAEIASEVFRANDMNRRIQLIRANSFDVTPPEPVDLLIHEIFGVDPFEEGVLASITDARRRWLKPGGRLLPMGFTVRGCAVGGPHWSIGHRQVEHITAMATEFGINLDAVTRAGRTGPTRRLDVDATQPTPSEVLTEPIDLIHVDLTSDERVAPRSTHALPPRNAGMAGAFLVWFDIHLDENTTLSTSPTSPKTHWGWQVWDLPDLVPVDTDTGLMIELSIETEEGSAQLELLDLYSA